MTQSHTTTLGAPLTEAEYNAMNQALADLRFYVDTLGYRMTPVELMAAATLVIDFGFKLRDSVTRGFASANKRVITDTARRPVNHLRLVKEPHRVNITTKDLEMLDLVNSILGDVPK